MKSILSLVALFACLWSASASTVDFTHYWTLEEVKNIFQKFFSLNEIELKKSAFENV
jgi:hypothetical protein